MNDKTKQLHNQYYFISEIILRDIQILFRYLLIENEENYNAYRKISLENIEKEFDILKTYLSNSTSRLTIYKMLNIEGIIDYIKDADIIEGSYIDTYIFLYNYVYKIVKVKRDNAFGAIVYLSNKEDKET